MALRFRASGADDFVLHNSRSVAQYKETLPNGVSHMTLDMDNFGSDDNSREYVVPESHYFVLGDNRDNSQDSRFLGAVGYVPRENIYAHVRGVVWSKDWGRIGLRVR